jgi:hypothetical protein
MYGQPEHVFVEIEWYDGPRAGVANVNGEPHRFVSNWDEEEGEYLGTFLVWPVGPEELALEQEQWRIFAAWNAEYEAGKADTATHPGHPGMNKRWDEIASQLAVCRDTTPATARRAKALLVHLERGQRYASSGPAYQLRWTLL